MMPVAHGSGGFAISHPKPKTSVKQRHRTSLLESCVNVGVGMGVAMAGQMIVFPLFGLSVSLSQTTEIAGIFTSISVVRSYLLRRLFEHMRVTGIMP